MLLLSLGLLLLHSSRGFFSPKLRCCRDRRSGPDCHSTGAGAAKPRPCDAHCQHWGCGLPWEATFHIRSAFPYHTTSRVRGRNITLANTMKTIPMLWHLQRNQSGLSKSGPSHSVSQTSLTPSLPRLSCCCSRATSWHRWGGGRASRKLLPSMCESPWSFMLFYTSPAYYRFLSCWKKRLHKSARNLEVSEVRQVPPGRGRTWELEEVGDKVFLRSKGSTA